MDNAWKDKLRDRFSAFSVPEPDGLWEGIEQGMAGQARRKRFPVWLVTGVAAAAAVVLAVILHPGTERTSISGPDAVLADVPTEPTAFPAADTASVLVPVTESPSERLAARRAFIAEVVSETTVPETYTVVPDVPESPDSYGKEPVSVIPEPEVENVPEVQQGEEPDAVSEPFRPSVSIGLFREGGQTISEQSQGYGMTQTNDILTRSTYSNDGNVGGLVRMLSSNKASDFEARHAAPVRFGIKAAWEVVPHLSLVSGLNWTILSSEFEESAASARTLVRQELGYLGIPLRLEAGFQPWKGLRLYADAGGMVEKGLLGSTKTYYYIGETSEDPIRDRVALGGVLWSVGASAGAEYRLTPSVGLYASPGVEYHFKSDTAPRSAYTDKPLHLNLSLGLRFQFGK